VSHDDKGAVPLGRRKISPAKAFQKQGQYLAKVVSGETPLDETSADVVRQYLEAHHGRNG